MVTEEEIREALRDCYDPEIPINIVDLGLIRKVNIGEDGKVKIDLTLTAVACPESETLAEQVKEMTESVPGVTQCEVELTWNPPWHPSEATPEGQWQLKAMGVNW